MALHLSPIPLFDMHGDAESCGIRWSKWITTFDNYITALGINENKRKIAILLHSAGEPVLHTYNTFPGINDTTTYAEAVQKLNEHFAPKKNTTYEIFRFRQEKQMAEETVDSYAMRLRRLAENCEFQDLDKEIKAQIIQNCHSTTLRRRALGDSELTLNNLLQMARIMEISEIQAKHMETNQQTPDSSQINAINKKCYKTKGQQWKKPNFGSTKPPANSAYNHHSEHVPVRPSFPQQTQFHNTSTMKQTCLNCGFAYPHVGGRSACPATQSQCHACGRTGHYSRCCLSSRSKEQRYNMVKTCKGKKHVAQHIRTLNTNMEEQSCDDLENNLFTIQTVACIQPTIDVTIAGEPIQMILDTGAAANIVNYEFYNCISKIVKLQPANIKLYAYGAKEPLSLFGSFSTEISYGPRTVTADFHILDKLLEKERAIVPLLGYPTMKTLGLLSQIQLINRDHDWKKEYQDLFTGVGRMKNAQVKLHIDPNITPVAQTHRRIPFHLRAALETEIQKLLNEDIIEPISGPTPWVSPVVLIPKDDTMTNIRICVDMRAANKAIMRERHPTPTIEDILHRVNGARFFSKLDLQKGYHQIELDEESRYITVFTTHLGLFQYKRLSFGISSAAEIFGHLVSQLLADIPGCLNNSDDILVFGSTEEEHDEALHRTLQRVRENDLTLKEEKCEFKKNEVIFFGHRFSSEGISIDPAKSEAVRNMSPPTNSEEVRSLLGFSTYCSRFIPNFADITAPLRQLTKKNQTWRWENTEQEAFETLREHMTKQSSLAYFNPEKKTILYVDASPTGLGGILTQQDQDERNQVILAYSSRALTPTESNYSQTEREALAVVYGCEHFHVYLIGSSFTIITDHLPLLTLLVKPKVKTSARIERWNLRLQPFDFSLLYMKGKLNPADYLSRHSSGSDTKCLSQKTEIFVNFVGQTSTPRALSWTDIKTATENDQTLQHIKKCLVTNQWHITEDGIDQTTKDILQKVANELTIVNGVLLKEHRIVIPQSLKNKVLQLAHEGHPGITKMKQLMHSKIWFTNMDKQIENYTQSCLPCSAVTPEKKPTPLVMSPLPERPWQSLSIDFCGPLPGGNYLMVIIDDFSRFPLVEAVRSTSTQAVIPVLQKIFSTFGLPDTIRTDNGPPFNGHEFFEFCQEKNIQHRKIMPLWPQANGIAERFMKTLKKAIQISQIEGTAWTTALQTFLMTYRNTPHSTTQETPFQLLFNREMKSKLPSAHQNPPKSLDQVRNMDSSNKQKMKNYADCQRHAEDNSFSVGDRVLVHQRKKNKLTSYYNPHPYVVTKVQGTMITARGEDHIITRHSSFFKLLRTSKNLTTPTQQKEQVWTNHNFCKNIRTHPTHQDIMVDRPEPRYFLRRNIAGPKRFIEEL